MDTMRERFTAVTVDLLDTNPRVALVLADIGVAQFRQAGVIARHPDRVLNVGIREQLAIGLSAGMAMEGFRPIVHSYAPFLVQRPWEQIRIDYGHQDVGAILVSIGATYDEANWGRTHQAPEDVALLGMLPGWQIDVPGHPDEVEAMLRAAADARHCVYIRLSTDVNERAHPTDGGRFATLREGTDGAATVIAVGPMLDTVTAATRDLDVNLLYASTVRPFDTATLRSALRAPEVILVEPYLEGTSSAEVSAALSDTPHRLLSLGTPRAEHRHYGSGADHYAAHGLDADGLRSRIGEFLAASAPTPA